MLPTVGRIIHVTEPVIGQCVAGLVTGLDYGPRVPQPIVYVTIFPPHGPEREAARRLTLSDHERWHDPHECPAASLGDPGPAG